MSTVHDQVYTIAVVTADVLYPLTIEARMRLHSRVVLANRNKPVKMLFDIYGLVDGNPIYRGLLDAFLRGMGKTKQDGENIFKDIFKVEGVL